MLGKFALDASPFCLVSCTRVHQKLRLCYSKVKKYHNLQEVVVEWQVFTPTTSQQARLCDGGAYLLSVAALPS